jgi:hypothetical protein
VVRCLLVGQTTLEPTMVPKMLAVLKTLVVQTMREVHCLEVPMKEVHHC